MLLLIYKQTAGQLVPNIFLSFQVSVFNTYIMGGLLMLKILLPLLMVSVFSVAVQKTSKVSLEALFTLVLLFCDIMGIHFFFLVTDKGSWLEIGVSLSHFIISEAIAVFLQALFLIAKILMDFPGSSCSRSQRQELPT
jgi:phosphatidylinositol glycan class N